MFRKLFVCSVAVLSVLSSPALLRAADAPKKPWKNSAELSLVSTNGNTKSQTTSAKDTFNYDWSKTSLELIGGGLSAKSQGVNTAEKYFASEKLSYKLSDRNYAFQKFAWDKDRFSGIHDRFDNNAGLGRELIKKTNDLLIGELGGGYIVEDRIGDENKDFATGRAYAKYVRTLSPTSNFSQDAEYLHNFEDPDDFRVNTETALTAAINTYLALKLSYVWKYVGVPPAGFGRNDTTTTVALVATF